ncbi:uncharacterized protein LOC111361020 [Spodoptera litura]|uniref:Uncharacterized protein LOC111361020 n=1 Tax=Spodoptera litura TaxID=69820 RepID=A0A9J7IY52_SPOLT|nr:uncharacterized protein LOC111361020 [Spodoptera litura]
MKMYILMSLVALFSITATLADNETLMTAVVTVLYYSDENGDKIVVAGNIDKEIERIIHHFINDNIGKDLRVEIVPIYEKVSEVPPVDILHKVIEEKYKHVYMAYAPLSVIRRVTTEKALQFKPKFLADLKHHKVISFARGIRNLIEEAIEADGNTDIGAMDDRLHMKSYSSLVLDSSIPNAIYFSIGRK